MAPSIWSLLAAASLVQHVGNNTSRCISFSRTDNLALRELQREQLGHIAASLLCHIPLDFFEENIAAINCCGNRSYRDSRPHRRRCKPSTRPDRAERK
jgi:hypothetical protein